MAKYAVVECGGHQYWVEEQAVFEVEKLPLSSDQQQVKLEQVLLVQDNGTVQVGQPRVQGASVLCDILGNIKGDKLLSFKFKRRKGYRRRVGHRQLLMRLKVKSIDIGK